MGQSFKHTIDRRGNIAIFNRKREGREGRREAKRKGLISHLASRRKPYLTQVLDNNVWL